MTFRKSKPPVDQLTALGKRIYYVWRLARFHGGADVCLPMGATMDSHADPFIKELDTIADKVAKMVFGSDMAAAYRWGGLLGRVQESDKPAGLPQAAYQGGIVHDGNKPIEEMLELH